MSTVYDAPRAGLAAPDAAQKDESHGFKAVASLEHGTVDGVHCADELTAEQAGTNDGKAFATLRAEYALRGYELTRSDPGDGPVKFFVTRWALCRELSTLADVAAFAQRVGATQ